MNEDQIKTIQNFQGDPIEEYWKPGSIRSERTYVDLFYYWEFREKLKACNLNFLHSKDGEPISRNFIFKFERLASYYYSTYCRIASMHQSLSDLEKSISDRGPLMHFKVQNNFESFYLFLGVALNNIGGVGTIIFGYKNKEDSFSDFLSSLENDENFDSFISDHKSLLNQTKEINENYRAHVAHRGRLSTLTYNKAGFLIPYTLASFEKTGPANQSLSWRKEIRDMKEGRKETLPMHQVCYRHLRIIENTVDLIFKITLKNIENFLSNHSVLLNNNQNQIVVDSTNHPKDANWILYRCNTEKRPYINIWFHDLKKSNTPVKCINTDCNSNDISAMCYVKD